MCENLLPGTPEWHPVRLARELLQGFEGRCAPITGQAVLTAAVHPCWVALMLMWTCEWQVSGFKVTPPEDTFRNGARGPHVIGSHQKQARLRLRAASHLTMMVQDLSLFIFPPIEDPPRALDSRD